MKNATPVWAKTVAFGFEQAKPGTKMWDPLTSLTCSVEDAPRASNQNYCCARPFTTIAKGSSCPDASFSFVVKIQ
jgi:hypothetical protein